MAKYSLVKNGVVTNVVEWSGDEKKWKPPGDVVVVPRAASPGDRWDGVNFLPPPPPEPSPFPPEKTKVDLLEERVVAAETKLAAAEAKLAVLETKVPK